MLPVLFFAFTVGVSIPSEIYFGNEKEFSVGYPQILPLILAVTAVLFAAAAGIAFLLRKQKPQRNLKILLRIPAGIKA